MKQYDIFISYRRRDAGDKAEHLKDLLEPKYKKRVSFDRENLTGIFDVALAKRIDRCRDFLLVVNKNSFTFKEKDFEVDQVALYEYLAKCSLEEFGEKVKALGHDFPVDFVRIEIARAIQRGTLNIIPIVPESTEHFNFSKLRLPPDIAGIKRYEAVFYSDNPDALFKDIIPKIRQRLVSPPDKPLKRVFVSLIALLLLLAIGSCAWAFMKWHEQKRKKELMVETALNGEQYLNWYKDITIDELEAVHEILINMVKVKGGTCLMGGAPDAAGNYDEDVDTELETPQIEQAIETFWIGKYEISVSEWYRIMGGTYDEKQAQMPVVNVSYDDCKLFVARLSDITGLDFGIPTEAEWEYAARGGIFADSTKYAGSNNPEKVAWYYKNSGGHAHVRNDINGGLYCNSLDLYYMSGNVSEWCSTDFRRYSDIASNNPNPLVIDSESKVIRGGNYDSEAYGITVYHREPMNVHEKAETVGLRIIIKTNE